MRDDRRDATTDPVRAFRLDNEVLAFRFTATVSDRGGMTPRERLATPDLLKAWFQAVGLPVTVADEDDLQAARALREAIYRMGAAQAERAAPAATDVAAVNQAAASGRATLQLEDSTAVWRLGSNQARDALGVLAVDAIGVLGGTDSARVRQCEGPDCAGLFVDGSHGQNRRWCSMNTCGNKIKKARLAKARGPRAETHPTNGHPS